MDNANQYRERVCRSPPDGRWLPLQLMDNANQYRER
jgi:hypothetical protein